MEKANRLASDAAFQGNNKGRDSWTIDLHGLYVEEAVQRARESIAKARGEVIVATFFKTPVSPVDRGQIKLSNTMHRARCCAF